ncbi:sugar phosphate isomerase/epimerase family protein [Phenylobacterium sp.]|uniref:sugar phosphate isomerase/epimerase family protein n=1 Tax=Phenylobacterium sp. TaxID=1871053 RepID=UPI0035695E20
MAEWTRRTALGWSLAATASALAGATAARTVKEPFFKGNGLPIGLQLYTLGDALKADLDGQLGQVARIGYRTVEMAGYLGRTPVELRAAFDKAGLACTSSHVQGKSTGPDPSFADLDRLIADAHVIGIKHIVMPMFSIPAHVDMAPKAGEDRRAVLARLAAQITADDWKATADFLNTKGRALKAAGLTTGYHNHNVEFAPSGGSTGLDILLANTDPALVQFEMDVGWVVAAGADPLALMKAHPGRFKMMHVKDVKATTKSNFAFQQDPAEVGSGIIDWKRLLAASYAAGVRDFFVEQEPPFAKPRMESVKINFDYLNTVVA